MKKVIHLESSSNPLSSPAGSGLYRKAIQGLADGDCKRRVHNSETLTEFLCKPYLLNPFLNKHLIYVVG